MSRYRTLSTADGLPSNYVYSCVEDDKGFLWVATDAGIARFDGKHFTIFTTHDGLPDNEVLEVIKEKNGRIWANCFKQRPAYYDEVTNRFINSTTDSLLNQIPEENNTMYCATLPGGGVIFSNNRSYVIKNGRMEVFKEGAKADFFFVKKNADGSVIKVGSTYNAATKTNTGHSLYLVKNGVYKDSIRIKGYVTGQIEAYAIEAGRFYIFDRGRGRIYICSNIGNNLRNVKIDSIKAPERFSSFGFTSDGFHLIGFSGKVIFYDGQTLRYKFDVSGKYLPNRAYRDTKGNLWIGTIDKGLICYENNPFKTVNLPQNLGDIDFLSIACKPDGTILAGSFYGMVAEAKGDQVKLHYVPTGNNIMARERKILVTKNKEVVTASEAGTYINYKQAILSYKGTFLPTKTAILYNDSVILFGLATGLNEFNLETKKSIPLRPFAKRVTAMARDSAGNVYAGSTDGLYKYNYQQNTATEIKSASPILSDRITGICVTPDNLVWVATASKGVAVLMNDKLLEHISEDHGVVNNATRCITTGKSGEIWIGTGNGLSRINYTLNRQAIKYDILNVTGTDGLTSNIINDIAWQRDTVYAATANGISIIPANITIHKFSIPVELTSVSINQRDTVLSKNYSLKYWQNNIHITFAGVELGGHFRNFQYTLDNGKAWLNLFDNTLTLQLESGDHTVKVRAVDMNGYVSEKELVLYFAIATPFWKSVWFWIATAALVQIVIIYYINQRQKRRKEARLAKQIAGVQTAALEQQAFTSLMNPHFMFNALNGIQHYINLQDRQNANRYLSDFASLIRKNFEAAQQSFITLEHELENIRIYLGLGQMRFTDRFLFRLTISDEVDPEEWMIPTMILQPLLENALLHGIMPSAIKGELVVDITTHENNLTITIADNGIGIKNSQAMRANNGHKSRGTELIKKRIDALNQFGSGSPVTMVVSPVNDDEKNPGNQVVLTIPPGIYTAWLAAQRS